MEIKQRVKKHFSHKTIKIILTKRRYYLPLVYILVNIGFIVSSLYPKGLYLNSYIYPLIFVVLPYTCFFLQVIYDYFFQNSDEEFKKKILDNLFYNRIFINDMFAIIIRFSYI